MDTGLRRAASGARLRDLRGAWLALTLVAGCAHAPPTLPSVEAERALEGAFLAPGMRQLVPLTLEGAACARVTVPLVGTLSDIDLVLFDDAGEVLASDLRAEGAPSLEVCSRQAVVLHVVVRVRRGAGRVRVLVRMAPYRENARATRSEDVVEEAFVSLDEPTSRVLLRAHAGELSRRGFLRSEPMGSASVPEAGRIELPVEVAAGECVTVSIASSGGLRLSLVDASGAPIVRGSAEGARGELRALQTCAEGAFRAIVEGDVDARFEHLVMRGRERDIGGATGLWLGRDP